MFPLVATALFALYAAQAAAHVPSLTLRQAVVEALAAGPSLRAPDDGRTLAEIRNRQAAARFGLKVTPTANFGTDPTGVGGRSMGVALSKQLPFGTTVLLNGNTMQFGTGTGQFRDTGYTFGFSHPLLRGWTTVASADRDQARRGTQTAARAYADARQRLVVAVAESYFAVVRDERLVDAAERTLARARQLKTVSDARSRVGLATELDVLRADLLISQSEAALASQSEALETAADALKTLIGRPAEDRVELTDTDARIVHEPADEPVEHFVQTALASRLEVREAHDRIGDAKRAASVARWNLLPPVSLDATYTRRGLGAGAPYLFGDLFNGWRVGLSTSYALDRSDQTAAAATAAVAVSAAQRDKQDADRRIVDEVRRAYRAWTRTKATLTIQSKAVAIAERQLRLAQLRYDRGVAGNFDVIDAENGLLVAQGALIGAEVERAIAGLTLGRVAGTLDPDRFVP